MPRTKNACAPERRRRSPCASARVSTTAPLTGCTTSSETFESSLEVVQLSIECVEPTVACYEAVGKQLAANRLLFAQIAPEKRKKLTVTITLFDVDAREPRTAQRTFANEKEASAGIADLVAEAIR